jgi:4'-phosphopantetheinyl transferase
MNIGKFTWGRINSSYFLPEDEVHVWRTTLDMVPSGLVQLRQILSLGEQERVSRFQFEVDRRRSVIGRGCLRLLLGQVLNLPANELQFEDDVFGKPSLLVEEAFSLEFNVSHSGDMVLIAITRGRAVGVDVEKIRTDLDIESVAAQFFSANEYRVLASLSGPTRYQAFFTCWTRKEAYLKARGVGLSLPLDQFDVSFLPDEEPRLLATRPDPVEASRWKLQTLDLSDDYAAALVAAGSAWKLRCWDWEPLLLLNSAR